MICHYICRSQFCSLPYNLGVNLPQRTHEMLRSSIICLLAMAFLARGAWIGPKLVLINSSHFSALESVYHDPATDLIHILVSDSRTARFTHHAISHDGTILYQNRAS